MFPKSGDETYHLEGGPDVLPLRGNSGLHLADGRALLHSQLLQLSCVRQLDLPGGTDKSQQEATCAGRNLEKIISRILKNDWKKVTENYVKRLICKRCCQVHLPGVSEKNEAEGEGGTWSGTRETQNPKTLNA
jgi:hypothetical protein